MTGEFEEISVEDSHKLMDENAHEVYAYLLRQQLNILKRIQRLATMNTRRYDTDFMSIFLIQSTREQSQVILKQSAYADDPPVSQLVDSLATVGKLIDTFKGELIPQLRTHANTNIRSASFNSETLERDYVSSYAGTIERVATQMKNLPKFDEINDVDEFGSKIQTSSQQQLTAAALNMHRYADSLLTWTAQSVTAIKIHGNMRG